MAIFYVHISYSEQMDNCSKSNVSFTSLVRPVHSRVFDRICAGDVFSFADKPWTLAGAKKAANAYTRGVEDCTAFCLTDCKDVFMLHIEPTSKENQDFKPIEKALENAFDLASGDIQAFVLGSREYSRKLYNNFVKFAKKHNLPLTELKGGDVKNNVAYRQCCDEFLISNKKIDYYLEHDRVDPKEILGASFEKVKLSDYDELGI